MNYILCHKEIPVLNFEADNDGTILKINEVYEKRHAPIGIFNSATETPVIALRNWWNARSIPASRQNLDKFLESLSINSPIELVSKSFGLSLSDHYWIKPAQGAQSNISWRDTNFFENDFSEDVGNLLTGIGTFRNIGSINFLSPENTSDGWLRKKWTIENGKRTLLKGGSGAFQQEPFNEVIASEICERLGIKHVDYKLTHHNDKGGISFFSACPDFVVVETELVPAMRIFSVIKKDNNTSPLKRLLKGCEFLGMGDIDFLKKELGKMFTLDFIIANTDRHFNNFGFLRNPDTLEWLGLAPIYDSGTSLFYNQGIVDLRNSAKHDSRYVETKPLAKTLDSQYERALRDTDIPSFDFSHLKGIGKDFSELLAKNPQNEGRSQMLGKILDDRILETEKFIEKQKAAKQNV